MADDGPERSCVGCRTRRRIGALVRITDGAEPRIDGPSDGRGAWLCRAENGVDPACLARAMRSRGFERAWRRRMDDDERQALRDRLAAWTPRNGATTDSAAAEGLTTGKG